MKRHETERGPVALTAKSVERRRYEPRLAPNGRPFANEVADAGMPGLYLLVFPSGKKGWAVRFRVAGRQRRLTLPSALTLAEARAAGRDALVAVGQGRDPAAEKATQKRRERSPERDRDLWESVRDEFLARHASALRSKDMVARLLTKECAAWTGRRIQDIGRRDVIALLDRVVDSGRPILANRLLAAVRRLFSWCVERAILPSSPCTGIRAPSVERSRDRILSDDEIKLLWRACDEVAGPLFGPVVKLLLLTGQRRNEVGAMEWRELDLASDDPTWTIPSNRTKNNNQHAVPLSPQAVALIRSVPRLSGSPFVFTTSGEAAISGWSRVMMRILAEMTRTADQDIPHFSLHDMRRTAASGMARLAVPIHVIEAVLNHKSGQISGVSAVYNRFDYAAEKRNALCAWSDFIENLITDKQNNVVSISQGKRKN